MPRIFPALLLALGATMWAQSPVGNYTGTIHAGGTDLRLGLHIMAGDAEGEWKATIDSLDQGAMGLPARIQIEGQRLTLTSTVGATITGTFDAAYQQISAAFKQGGIESPITFQRVARIEEPTRPQMPQRPFPYNETELFLDSGGVRLAGTLTTPKGDGPFAAAILLTGSGPQDRDETLFGHKPFLVIADQLTRAGFAVFRMDDRGTGKSGGVLARSTYDDFERDVQTAFTALRSRKEIDPARIGLIGHSEGAAIAQLAASRNSAVAFIVLMAGPGVPGDQLLYEQGKLGAKAAGAGPAIIERQRRAQETFLTVIRSVTDTATLPEKLRESVAKFKAELPPAEVAAAGAMLDKQLEGEIQRSLTPPFISLVRYDPAPVLAKIACPVLAINGTLDIQVAHYQNLPAIATALAANLHPDYTVAALPKLNHLFQSATTGSIREYGKIEETFSPKALNLITSWLTARFAPPAR